ncbi:MAG: hypothetical protein ACREDY_21930 [Bradyrhizobium sp.]
MPRVATVTGKRRASVRVFRLLLGLAAGLILCEGVPAQPTDAADQQQKTVSPYLYLMDSDGNKVLLSTQFWRNDPKYDDRAFHRFLDLMTALEKRGFHKNEKAVIEDWDRPEPFVRCYVYLEDLRAGGKTKGGVVSGSRVWCSDNGASEHDIRPSDTPKHIGQVLKYFDEYLARAKARLHK